MNTSSEAIEAAAEAIAQIETGNDGVTVANEVDRIHARAALKAAAPHIGSAIVDELRLFGWHDAADLVGQMTSTQ